MDTMRIVRIGGCVVAGLAVLAVAASFHPMVRNVYGALSPSQHYDAIPPPVPSLDDPAVLVFTKTNGFRHGEAIEAGVTALQDIARQEGWSLFHTENSAVFETGILAEFRVVVWHNASGAPLNDVQRAMLRGWIEGGGGFVGIHAALDDSHASWSWYVNDLLGARFIGHILGPQFQEATVRVEQPGHRAARHLVRAWPHVEEWYSFDRSVRGDKGVEVLATVDETTYSPRLKFLLADRELSMGDHPVLWTRSLEQGRAFFSVLGHQGALYGTAEYRGVLAGAVAWAGRLDDAAESKTEAREGDEEASAGPER